jgi:hypothetical protein
LSTETDNQRLLGVAGGIKSDLEDDGWVVVNALGEQATPNGVLWFTSTYTHGEYTLEASFRPKGYGRAEGVTRVRVTPPLVAEYPELGATLARELTDKHRELLTSSASILDLAWPPPTWARLAR